MITNFLLELTSFLLTDAEETGMDARNEKIGSVFQVSKNKIKKNATRREGTLSTKPSESDSSSK
jgi:hypothetical protein